MKDFAMRMDLLSRPAFHRRFRSAHRFACNMSANSHTTSRIPVREYTSSGSYTKPMSDQKSENPECSFPMYKPMEDIEPFERYTVGDYYPVRIGERFCSARYHIVHKLGHGSYATIWLARDEILAKYVAIKFCVSGLDRPFEGTILKALWDEGRRAGEEHIGVTLFPKLLGEFEVEGPEIRGTKRKHRCLVTTPAMMSIAEA